MRLDLQVTVYNSKRREIITLLFGLQTTPGFLGPRDLVGPRGLLCPLGHLGPQGLQDILGLLGPWGLCVFWVFKGLQGILHLKGPQDLRGSSKV